MTAFSRVRWDPTCLGYGETRRKRPGEIISKGRPGYARVDYALHTASWTVAATMKKLAYSWERIEGARGLSEGLTHLPRYEPHDTAQFTRQVKKAAKLYGASTAGICKLDRRWLYSENDSDEPVDLPSGVDTAIVIGLEMDWNGVMTSPSITSSAATGNGYSRMAFTAVCLAEFLRDLGWQALPCGNDTALSIPLAIDAGLGELGRNGLLITPKFGPRLRLCKVLTDAPLVPDRPIDFGVRKFCEVCLKCAQTCPSGAISRGEQTFEGPCPSNNSGVLKWYTHAEKCLHFWNRNGGSCLNCIRSCPFNKPLGWIHDAARKAIRGNIGRADAALVKIDDLMQYGFQRDAAGYFWEMDHFIHETD